MLLLRWRRRSLLVLVGFAQPGCHASCLWTDGAAAADAVSAAIADRGGIGRAGMPVGREVLVKLVDIEGLDVGDDVAAQLANIHVTEVNVELTSTGAIGQRAEAAFTL